MKLLDFDLLRPPVSDARRSYVGWPMLLLGVYKTISSLADHRAIEP